MRVSVVDSGASVAPQEVPWQGANSRYLDLRENPRLITEVAPAREHPALGRFLAAVNSDDSLFSTVRCSAEAGANLFLSTVSVVYADAGQNFDDGNFRQLCNRIAELLTRDSPADTLAAELSVSPCRFRDSGGVGFCLSIVLRAEGDTAEQAGLRWSLGLVRIQQALLFLSRVLRQQQRPVAGNQE